MLKVSAFYLEKLKSFIPKKIYFRPQSLKMPRQFQKMALAVLIFSEGFAQGDQLYLNFISQNTLFFQDYHWWWRSFLTSGFTSFYLCVYCVHYFMTKLEIEGAASTFLYFGYTSIIVFTFFILTGMYVFVIVFDCVRNRAVLGTSFSEKVLPHIVVY